MPVEISIKKGRECSLYLLGVKIAVLVPLRVFRFKRSAAGTFAVYS